MLLLFTLKYGGLTSDEVLLISVLHDTGNSNITD